MSRRRRSAPATIGQHHSNIDQHTTRIMPTTTLPQRRQRLTELRGQPGRIGQVGQQP